MKINDSGIILIDSLEKIPRKIGERLSKANVFFSKAYQKYATLSNEEMLYAFDDKHIIPICVYHKLFLKYALFASEPYIHGVESTQNERKLFLDRVLKELKKTNIAWISTSAGALFDVYPDESVRIPFGSHVVELTLSEEELWAKIHSKHRNSIRRAEKGKVEIRFGGRELIGDYVKLDQQTWARSGRKSYGTKFFENIVDGLEKNAQVVVAYKENQPQAGGIFFRNKKMSYYMYGTSTDHPEPGSANLLQWENMIKAKKEGVEKYSFVGCRINEDINSKYHNIQRFKERFGGELVQGYMFRSVIHPFMRKTFMFLYKMKHGKDLYDAIDMELPKWIELNSK